ncbi:uncharacterized protein LOC108050761 [Drosophila rhopaloa]|uniref:Uncharacterized protein LOC108050761 n=1 Tax=Drosophila rhopaloa TaxID=1041015 RepID=A0A6P4FDB1_DRORH|nr:uncharacterized protein LOC108050761 [Drosophila rhopaloa]
MNTEDLVDFTELISCKSRCEELALPNVQHIKDIREFMSDPENFNGDIDELTGRLNAKAEQCHNVLQTLKERLQTKTVSLQKVKEDIFELSAEIKKPNNRFVMSNEKIQIRFLDETETKEYEAIEAMDRYGIKMSSLFSEILALDSDVDCVTYLEGVSRINIEYVKDWYKSEIQNKNDEVPPNH